MSIVIGVNLNKFRGGGTPTPPSPIPPTSYTNPGGSGNRVGSIAVTATCDFQFWAWPPFNEEFINGDLTGAGQVYENAEAVAGKWVNFDFGAGVRKVIDESTLYMSNGLFSMGNRKWQGSVEESATPADGSFVDIGGAFAVGATPS